jgi:hypothetical protein
MAGKSGWQLREGEQVIVCKTGLLAPKHFLIGITRIRNEPGRVTHVPLEPVHARLRGDACRRTAAAAAFLLALVSPAARVAASRHRRLPRTARARARRRLLFLLGRVALELPHQFPAAVENFDRDLLRRVLQVVAARGDRVRRGGERLRVTVHGSRRRRPVRQ